MATRSCCSIPHTAAAGVRSATSEPAPCRATKHSNASATIHTSWNYGRPTRERPQLIDTHDEHRSLETTGNFTAAENVRRWGRGESSGDAADGGGTVVGLQASLWPAAFFGSIGP